MDVIDGRPLALPDITDAVKIPLAIGNHEEEIVTAQEGDRTRKQGRVQEQDQGQEVR